MGRNEDKQRLTTPSLSAALHFISDHVSLNRKNLFFFLTSHKETRLQEVFYLTLQTNTSLLFLLIFHFLERLEVCVNK